ncbi:FtsX-like permease family protein [Cellulomonas sp. NPDC089187]|uniref:ABC transporter permease n=1 Tax=Cellulomonas sp. NPDC089187 TaxID=3154970 RepID=UPI003444CCF9
MSRVGWRSIRAHLGRFALSLLAVTLGVAFVAGTFSLRSAMSGSFDGIVESSAGGDVYLQAPTNDTDTAVSGGFGATGVPISLVDEAEQIDGVERAEPTLSVPVVLVGADGTAVRGGMAPSMAMLWAADDPSWTVLEGRGPQNADEIALEKVTLEHAGLSVGDTTTIVLAGELTEVTVVGQLDIDAAMMGATIVLVDAESGMARLSPDGMVDNIEVTAAEGVDPETLVERLAPLTGSSVRAVTGESLRADTKESIDEILGFVTTFLLIFAGIALFVGGFIISNTFAMSVRQRMREFALLRAVGASPAQVFGSIVLQAAVVGVLGSVLGVAAGFGLVEVIRVVIGSMGMDMGTSVPVDVTTIVVSLLVGTLVSVLAAAVPARRAALVPPVEAMREEVVTGEKSLRLRSIIGTVLVGLGLAAVIAAVANPGLDWALTADGLGAAAVLVGVLMLSPVLARAVIRVLAWPFVVLLRPIGRLARGNVVRHPRRTANTAGALMIGMALVGAVSVIAVSAKSSMSEIIDSQMDSDFVLTEMTGAVPAELIDQVRELPDVEAVDAMGFTTAQVAVGDLPSSAQIVAGMPEGVFGRSLNVEVTEGDLASLADGQLVVKEENAEAAGWKLGDSVTITGQSGQFTATIGALISTETIGAPFMMPADGFDELVPPALRQYDTVMVHAVPGVDLDAVHDQLVEVAKPYVVVSVMTAEDYKSQLAGQVDMILAVMYALLGLSVVIAVLGIVNTLALSVIERTREIGLLRAVGLGRLQLSATVIVESVLTSVFGTLIGLGIGVGLAATLPDLMADMGFNQLSIPWGSLVGMLGLAVVVGVLAALWPGARAARMKVLDSIAYE